MMSLLLYLYFSPSPCGAGGACVEGLVAGGRGRGRGGSLGAIGGVTGSHLPRPSLTRPTYSRCQLLHLYRPSPVRISQESLWQNTILMEVLSHRSTNVIFPCILPNFN